MTGPPPLPFRLQIRMATAQYTKFTHQQHILELPDTYIGSIDETGEKRFVYNTDSKEMEYRTVRFVPGLLKVIDEPLVNSMDQRVRQNGRIASGALPDGVPVKHIDVVLTDTTISIYNDGDGIPVGIHTETGIEAAELIFGHLLTSSNYDKGEEKVVGGKNGYGAKLTNIFSSKFTVETVDHRSKKKYEQTWSKNMTVVGKAKITAVAATVKPYVKLTFTPDLTRFHWSSSTPPTTIPADMLAVLATRVVDAAACSGKDCRVTLNGHPVLSNTFPKYIDLYLKDSEGSVGTTETAATAETAEGEPATVGAAKPVAKKEPKRIAFEVAGERWEIGAMLTRHLHGDAPPDERHISFVNGIATRRGGKHVEHVAKTVLTAFCEVAKKKAKLDLTPAILKDSLVWFINSTIVNPSFDTQTKETLTTPVDKFGSKPVISPKFVDQLLKIGLLDEAQALMDARAARDAKKTDGKKKSTLRGYAKLDDAEFAGTAKSAECTLILTEGDSAKTTAISGLAVVGRKHYGVFPLKGKILNVMDVASATKTANVEIAAIKAILGLETGKIYTDLKQLRYGRVMIMTDQDVDGSHIKGLLMNLFHCEWPSLLKLGFLCCLMTPLLKATKGSQTLCFYSDPEYEAWKATQGEDGLRGWSTKYYKGLGTSTASEARDYFTSMNTVEYLWDGESAESLDLAFNKKRADDRKTWLTTYDKDRHLPVTKGGSKVSYTLFVNDELIHFSSDDNIRSLPDVMDGLKPSQRKIFWAAKKRNLWKEIRVAQLAGYVSETAAYHHGEASLTGAITGMAQIYVGSNNLNLLAPNGQFGTRLMGGKDAASPRYIHTELMPIVRALVKKEDDAILSYTEDDGTPVEPVSYYPVVPLLLVNGCTGIGTGFSSDVPPYNPEDLSRVLKDRLAGRLVDLKGVELTPWFYGFKGRVITGGAGKPCITKGVYQFANDDTATVRITELPIGTWTQDYKEFLENMLKEQEGGGKKAEKAVAKGAKPKKVADPKKPVEAPTLRLKSYTANYNDVDVDFTLELDPDYYHTARAYPAEFEKTFELNSSLKMGNMVAFDTMGKIRRYAGPGEIMEEFYGRRLSAYGERKAHELARMDKEIIELDAKHRFVKAVVEKRLVVANAEDAALLAGLRGLLLPALSDGEDLKGYEYLLRMRVDRLKASAVAELEAELAKARAERETLDRTTIQVLWSNDLAEFDEAWKQYVTWRQATNDAAGTAAPVKKVVKKVVAAKKKA